MEVAMRILWQCLAVVLAINSLFFALIVLGFLIDGEAEIGARIVSIIFSGAIATGSFWAARKLWPNPRSNRSPVAHRTTPQAFATKKDIPEPLPVRSSPELPDNLTYSLKKPVLESLVTLAEITLADDEVHQREAELLLSWFAEHPDATNDHRTALLHRVLERCLEDQVLDPDEADEIKTCLSEFCDRMEAEWQAEKEKAAPALRKPVKPKPVKSKPVTPPSVSTDFSFIGAGTELLINYVDSKGIESERTIAVRNVTRKNGQLYLNAICLEKHKYRSFRADRVQDMTILDTGEFVPNPLEYLAAR
jgi:hypothetical protein